MEKLLMADGYRIALARDERDAIERAQRTRPDLILVSLAGLPREVVFSARSIRQRAEVGDRVPVVVLCNEGIAEGDEVEIGDDVHVTRPDNFNQLRSLIARLLDKTMLFPQLEARLQSASHALNRATNEDIIELCKQYLALLAEYRTSLYELANPGDRRGTPPSSSSTESRKTIRAAIEKTTRERNRTEMLLRSLTTISGYEAVELFNRQHYEGCSDWELRASGVKSTSSAQDLMTIQEAVDIASLLRRDEQIAKNSARPFAGSLSST
jgi:CheY-like chemotaxis protein